MPPNLYTDFDEYAAKAAQILGPAGGDRLLRRRAARCRPWLDRYLRHTAQAIRGTSKEERFKHFAAACTHKYENWLILDDVTDFIGARHCFDKHELAGAPSIDEDIAVSALGAKPERAAPTQCESASAEDEARA